VIHFITASNSISEEAVIRKQFKFIISVRIVRVTLINNASPVIIRICDDSCEDSLKISCEKSKTVAVQLTW